MSVEIVCACGNKIVVPDRRAGTMVECPICGGVTLVPEKPSAAKPVKGKKKDGASEIRVEKAKVRKRTPRACPGCGAILKKGVVLCVNCGFDVTKGRYVAAPPAPKPAGTPSAVSSLASTLAPILALVILVTGIVFVHWRYTLYKTKKRREEQEITIPATPPAAGDNAPVAATAETPISGQQQATEETPAESAEAAEPPKPAAEELRLFVPAEEDTWKWCVFKDVRCVFRQPAGWRSAGPFAVKGPAALGGPRIEVIVTRHQDPVSWEKHRLKDLVKRAAKRELLLEEVCNIAIPAGDAQEILAHYRVDASRYVTRSIVLPMPGFALIIECTAQFEWAQAAKEPFDRILKSLKVELP